MFLKVTNTSAIQASLSLHVIHFPASKPPTPPSAQQMPGKYNNYTLMLHL